jgi:hypothetical protein
VLRKSGGFDTYYDMSVVESFYYNKNEKFDENSEDIIECKDFSLIKCNLDKIMNIELTFNYLYFELQSNTLKKLTHWNSGDIRFSSADDVDASNFEFNKIFLSTIKNRGK